MQAHNAVNDELYLPFTQDCLICNPVFKYWYPQVDMSGLKDRDNLLLQTTDCWISQCMVSST